MASTQKTIDHDFDAAKRTILGGIIWFCLQNKLDLVRYCAAQAGIDVRVRQSAELVAAFLVRLVDCGKCRCWYQ